MPLELWAGAECTVNRVHDRYHDQMEASGFAHRVDDIDRLAGLGITRMRFPVIWERTLDAATGELQWDWSDVRIARMRELGVKPIVGLVHHGSGPAFTHLLDEKFPELLADYARAVAKRYPDVDAWTPVNEPLTTARFSALYGHWYPHRTDDRSFVRALLVQMRATILAMRAIREVIPDAMLVQTEDLGHTTSSPSLAYQADFENHRRWLSFDLLTGRIDARHPLRQYLRDSGATQEELDWFEANPCPPDILGINSYITSERYLDARTDLYPEAVVGGNGRDRYADVETVRVAGGFVGGFSSRLREAWERYRLPMAITEAHLGCSREEQLRWLHQAWQSASDVKAEGCDVRAVTCWAAFGIFDWDSLVTRWQGHYEPGLWDIRSDPPRETALCGLARELSQGTRPKPHVIEGPGWWHRESRLLYVPPGDVRAHPVAGRPILITGATGTLGQAFARMCAQRGIAHVQLDRKGVDIADPLSVEPAIEQYDPWAIVNTAGFVRVDEAEQSPRQWRENLTGPVVLAQACAQRGVRLMTFSTDLVFDGGESRPYLEADTANPLNAYGRAKRVAELQVLGICASALIVRTAAFFGPWDRHNFATLAIDALRRGETWHAAQDQHVSPTYVPDLVNMALDLLLDGESGIWHLANRGSASWSQFASMIAEAAGLDRGLVRGVPGATLGQRAPRPRYSALGSGRGAVMPSLDDALARYIAASSATAAAKPAPVTSAAPGQAVYP